MRPSLSVISERRHGRGATRRALGPSRPRRPEAPVRDRDAEPAVLALREDLLRPDADLCRAREAGGPEDVAQYACACGYVFAADVSTSVACPHCGTAQAW